MQDCLALREELVDLRRVAHAGAIDLVAAPERWNPVAAVVLRGVEMPPGIAPNRLDLRIPLPNLYGFAASASAAFVDEPLVVDVAGEPRPVPFCEPLTDELLARHAPYLADVRAHADELRAKLFLCLTPTWSPGVRFRHISLAGFVQRLLEYLRSPYLRVRRELVICDELWRTTGDPWWLVRIGHLHEGMGELERAQTVYAAGAARYQGRADFAALLERLGQDSRRG